MSTPVLMPQMGESIAEGTVVRWIKKVGDQVDRDEPLFEISTDKVDAEIPSPAAGVLSEIRVKEGETVAVNSVVATIGDSAIAAAADAQPAAAAADAASPSTQPCPTRSNAPSPTDAGRETRPQRRPNAARRRRGSAPFVAAGAPDREGAPHRHRGDCRAPASAAA